jgi:hypothetical protein
MSLVYVTPGFFAGGGSLLRSGAGDAASTVEAVAVARTALSKSELSFIGGLLSGDGFRGRGNRNGAGITRLFEHFGQIWQRG